MTDIYLYCYNMNKIEYGMKLDFSNVLIRPKRSTINSRSEVDLSRVFNFKYSPLKWSGTPIISANMDTTGTFDVYKVLSQHNIITALHKFYTVDDFRNFKEQYDANPDFFMISTGIGEGSIDHLVNVFSVIECNWICIDIANGYISNLVDFCKKVRKTFPDKRIVAGNVVTREMVEELILEGLVDVVKIGIGPGAACTTRLKTGVGMPQLSAILECADAAHGVGGLIIGDGGITSPGDMAKAFGGGADFVMAGSAFAGHDENPGEIEEINGIKVKKFYGMSSKQAMNKHYGKMAEYRSSEGRELKINYKGPLIKTIHDYLGGLRSACTYINARTIKQMAKCTTFIQVSQQLNTSLV
jgi:GMP reductase